MDGLSFAIPFLDVAGRVRFTRLVLRASCEPCGQCSCWLPETTNVLRGVRIGKAVFVTALISRSLFFPPQKEFPRPVYFKGVV
jgi:hypothetical protein